MHGHPQRFTTGISILYRWTNNGTSTVFCSWHWHVDNVLTCAWQYVLMRGEVRHLFRRSHPSSGTNTPATQISDMLDFALVWNNVTSCPTTNFSTIWRTNTPRSASLHYFVWQSLQPFWQHHDDERDFWSRCINATEFNVIWSASTSVKCDGIQHNRRNST